MCVCVLYFNETIQQAIEHSSKLLKLYQDYRAAKSTVSILQSLSIQLSYSKYWKYWKSNFIYTPIFWPTQGLTEENWKLVTFAILQSKQMTWVEILCDKIREFWWLAEWLFYLLCQTVNKHGRALFKTKLLFLVLYCKRKILQYKH